MFSHIAFSSFSFIVQVQVQGLAWMQFEKKYDHRSLLTPSLALASRPAKPQGRPRMGPTLFSLPRLCRLQSSRHPSVAQSCCRGTVFFGPAWRIELRWRPGLLCALSSYYDVCGQGKRHAAAQGKMLDLRYYDSLKRRNTSLFLGRCTPQATEIWSPPC